MSKTLEKLQVLLTADDSDLRGTFSKATKPIGKFRDKLRGVGQVAKPLAGAITAIGAAAVGAGLKAGRMADELLDLSEQTGLTTDQLQEYRRVTNQAGVETDTIARAAEQMTMRMSRGAEGSADLRDGLSQLGISAKDAEGNLRPMSEIVDEAIVGLAGMKDETKRNVLATKLFSRGANELAPVLGLGADEITRLREEAGELGLVIGRDALEDANQFRASWDGVKQELGGVVNQVGIDLIPTLQSLADKIQGSWRPAIEAVADTFVLVIEGAVNFGANIEKIFIGISAVVLKAMTAIVDTVGRFGEAIPILGDKIAVAREAFHGWANVQMTQMRDRMDELNTSTRRTTTAIEEQSAAAAKNATTMGEAAAAVGEASKFEEVKLLELDNTIQTLGVSHEQLEEVAVGSSANIKIKAGTAFQQMSDAIAGSATRVLGHVRAVLNQIGGGGGFLGGITGAIGGFLSGGPIGAGLGFIGGLQHGGTMRPGQSAIVGEAGPELVTAGVSATVTPMSGVSVQLDRSSLPPQPRAVTPDALAVDAWWREAFSHLVADGRDRGVF